MRERNTPQINYKELLDLALTTPGRIGEQYSRFHPLSFNNNLTLFSQWPRIEPMNTYKRWLEMDHQVKKGSKAKYIWRPMFATERDKPPAERDTKRLVGFTAVNCMFAASETEGPELPPYEPPEWSRERLLGGLGISMVDFEDFDGNTQGYSYNRNIAVNPVAKFPFKTFIHEAAHIVLGHTVRTGLETVREVAERRPFQEFQAESVAMIVTHELGAEKDYDKSQSFGYIQNHLMGRQPEEHHYRGIFSAVDKILKAGREETVYE